MDKVTPLSLGDHFSSFVETKVAEGRYASASAVVQAGLHLLEEQEGRLAALRVALDEGDASGLASAFDLEAFLAEKRGGHVTGR